MRPRSEHDRSRRLRVMSYNVRYDTDSDEQHAWSRRRDHVVETISTTQPDIVGLQEPLEHQLSYLDANLSEYSFFGVGREDGERGGEFVPIGYRTDRFTLVDRGAFWLSETPDDPGSLGWDAACPRVTTWAVLEVDDDSSSAGPLTVFNTHFDHRSALARHRSAQVLRSRVADALATGPVIVTGDLNCPEPTSPCEVLVGGPGDAGASGDPTGSGDPDDLSDDSVLRDCLHAADIEHRGPRRTYHAFSGLPLERRDYVLVDPSFVVRSSRTIDEREWERFSSDHFPIVADVSLPSRP